MDSWPTFHDIVSAYKSCRLHKPANHSQALFESRLGDNLLTLHREIHSGRYRPYPARCFVVMEPKPREIFAADFRDRVVHHLVVGQLEPAWEKRFIYSSFACRVGKGTFGAIKHVRRKVREISQGGNKPVWALQFDVAKFFVTINRSILCDLLLEHVRHPKLRELIQVIYRHDARIKARRIGNIRQFDLIPPGKSWFAQGPEQGIAIGNLSSQFGANVYLSGLDHIIQRQLRPLAYLRYMDDGLALDVDSKKLEKIPSLVDQWLVTHRAQQLNPSKTHLIQLATGIDYLGFHLRQEDSASEPLQIFSAPVKKWKWINALQEVETSLFSFPQRPHPLAPVLPNEELNNHIASLNSRLGALHHSRSFLFWKETLEKFVKNATEFKDLPRDFADPWCPFKLKRGYKAIRLK